MDDDSHDTETQPEAAPTAASAAPAAPVALVAVITEPYGELKRLPQADAQKLIDAKQARIATDLDIRIAG